MPKSSRISKMGVQIIRYSTHSCLDPDRSRKVVRYPGVLTYNKRCAVIATRLKNRNSDKKSKKNWLYHRLLLPPKTRKRSKVSKNHSSHKRKKVPSENSCLRKFVQVPSYRSQSVNRLFDKKTNPASSFKSDECLKHHDGLKIFQNDHSKNVGDKFTTDEFYARDEESASMPLNEWKIVLNKKPEEKKEPNDFHGERLQLDNTLDSEIAHQQREAETVKFVDVNDNQKDDNDNIYRSTGKKAEALMPVDQWYFVDSKLPSYKKEQLVWSFPVLPSRTITLPLKQGVLYRRKYPLHEKSMGKSLVAFEVLTRKVNLHPRPALWTQNETENTEEEETCKMNIIDIDLLLPSLENKSPNGEFETLHRIHLSDVDGDQNSFVQPNEKLSVNGNSVLANGKPADPEDGNDILSVQDVRFHLKNPVVRKLLNSDKFSPRPLSSKSGSTNSTIIGRQNAIVKNIVKTKQWTGGSSSSNTSVAEGKLRANSSVLKGDYFDEEEFEESLFADDEPKPQKKKKKSYRKKNLKQEHDLSTKSGPFASATDLLDNDIFSELMKLYIPRDNYRQSAAGKEVNVRKKRKKRKRTASKKRDEARMNLREDLLVSLKRNTAYWYEVTSRLQNVSEKPDSTMDEDQMENGKKNLKAAVQKAFPRLGKRRKENSRDSSSRPSSPKLPPIGQKKPHSKFYKAAAAVVNAERNYYNFLPPLNSYWSEALEDLFPSLALVRSLMFLQNIYCFFFFFFS